MGTFYKCIRYFAYMIEILVFYVLEQVPMAIPAINGVKPILLVPAAIMISLFEGTNTGMIFGLIIGIFLDCGADGELGFYSVIMTCIGFIVGIIAQKMIKFNMITAVLISIIFITIIYISHFLVKYLLNGYSDLMYVLSSHYLIGILYTAVLSPFLYFFNKAFAVNIKEKE